MDAELGDDLREILEANSDLADRIDVLDVAVSYDSEFDIFLVTLGKPQPAIVEEIPNGHGLHLRLDPDSNKIVGYEILGFEQRYLKAHPDFRAHFEALFEDSPIDKRDIPHRGRQHRRAQQALRELIPA